MDYELELKVRNGRITQAMKRAGIASVAELARRAGTSPNTMRKIINLQLSPLNQYGEWRHAVLEMAVVLDCLPTSLFNDDQMSVRMETNMIQVPMSSDQLACFLGQSPGPTTAEEIDEIVDKRLTIHRAMKCLSDQEAQVLTLKMESILYKDIAEVMNLTIERVLSVEIKASKKVRIALDQTKKGLTI